MTMICVTHEMGFARQVADRVIFMAEGAIVEEAPPEQFFSNPQHERTKKFLGEILRIIEAVPARRDGGPVSTLAGRLARLHPIQPPPLRHTLELVHAVIPEADG